MTGAPLTSVRTMEEAERRSAARRERAIRELGPDAVAWLVLVPAWTDALATRAGFPTGGRSLDALVEEFEALNWALQRPVRRSGVDAEEAADLLAPLFDALERQQQDDPSPERAEALRDVQHALAARAFEVHELGRPRGASDAEVPGPSGEDVVDVLPALSANQLTAWLSGHLADATADVLAEGLALCARESDPRAAARTTLAAAARLTPQQVHDVVATLAARVLGTGAAEQTTIANLATAAATAGLTTDALQLTERLDSDRLLSRTLSTVAAALVSTDGARAVPSVVQRLRDSLFDGQHVDLPAAASAVERLVGAGAPEAARPLLELVQSSLGARVHRGAEVGALVRLVGADATGAPELARAALEAARAEGDPAIRAAALVQVLDVCTDDERAGVLRDALQAARAVVDEADRAHALARVVPSLPPTVQAEVLTELVGLCSPDESTFAFWAVESVRGELVERIVAALGPRLLDVCGEIGRSLLRQRSGAVTVPAATYRWATLAAELSRADAIGEEAGNLLLATVRRLLDSGATGEALGWAEVAGRLVPVVHGTFETSVLLANRRIEVEQRKQRLREDLRRFLRRDELVQAFDRLIDEPDDGRWALHYLGHGGVGKTTLLRYLAAELAPSRGRAMAWVDFDRLSPDFPATRPGQLLLDLLEDLEGYASGEESSSAYQKARAELRGLRWWAAGGTPERDKERAVAAFCAFLKTVERPVVLVLDTCEELTKFQPKGAGVPQLTAAFDLVEQVHSAVPGVRVVFAGRRPLALHGADGWVVDEARRPASVPEEKEYLQVLEVAGFTEDEAISYLRSVENLALEPDALDTVLERCRDPLVRRFGGDHDDGVQRYSPFDLALFASVLREDPELVQAELPGDIYVETRVQRRLGERWAFLLPVVAVLRRFDRTMLGCAVDPAALDDAWRELQATEWTSAVLDPATEAVFLEVDPGLLVRLDAHYAGDRHRPELSATRARLAQPLATLLTGAWTADPPLEAVEAAVRAVEPEAAARLMTDLMLPVANRERWSWAFSVCGRLLGPDGVLADPDHPAAPAARTLYGVAHARTVSDTDLTDHWREVAARANQHPDDQLARWLRVHALLLAEHGDADSLRDGADLAGELLAGSNPAGPRPEWGFWLLGTCLTEVDELAGQTVAKPSRALLRLGDRLAEAGRRPLAALALVAAAELRPGRPPSRAAVTTALEWCGEPGQEEVVRFVSADHPGLRSVRHRVRLHALRQNHPVEEPAAWLVDSLSADRRDPDADRLAGLVLSDWLDHALVPADVLEHVADALGTAVPPPGTAAVHAGLPPLRVVLCRAWTALGEDAKARDAAGPAGKTVPGTPEQLWLDVARVQVTRWFRRPDKDRRLRAALRADRRPGEVPLVVETTGLLTPLVPDLGMDFDELDLHVLWRSSSLSDRPLAEAVELAAQRLPRPGEAGSTATSLHLQLDLEELGCLARPSPDDGRSGVPGAVIGSLGTTDLTREERVALALRAAALSAGVIAPRSVHAVGDALVSHPRLVAEIALAEGELLALRLPLLGAWLLEFAATQYRVCQDPLGELRAAVLAQLARRRGGRRVATSAGVEGALARAHAFRPSLPGAVADLQAWAADAEPGSVERWQGWLDRIELAVSGVQHAWSRPRTQPQGTSPELRLQVAAPPPVPPDARPSSGSLTDAYRKVASSLPPAPGSWSPAPVPVESSDPVGAAQEASPSPGSPGGRSSGGRAARVAFVVVSVLAVLAVVGGLVAIVVLLYRGFQGAAQGLQLPGSGSAWLTVPAFVVVLAILGWALVRFLDSGPANNQLTVTVRDRHGQLTFDAVGWRERRFPLPPRRARTALTVPALIGGEPVLDPSVAERELARLAHATKPLQVAVDASLRLTGTSWERVLGSWLAPLGPARFHRVQTGGSDWRGPSQLPGTDWYLGELSGRVVLAASPHWWPSLARAARGVEGRSVVGPELPEGGPQPGDVVVVVGAVVGERAGSRIVVPGHRGQDQVVEPDEFGAAASVLVCALPATHGAELDELPRLRRCAADLVLAGCAATVVLPPLPPDVLREAVHILLADMTAHSMAFPGWLASPVQRVRDLLSDLDPALAVEVTELRAR